MMMYVTSEERAGGHGVDLNVARQARHWQTKSAKVNVWAVVVPDNIRLLLWSSTFASSLQGQSRQVKVRQHLASSV